MPAGEPVGAPKRALSYRPLRSPASARLHAAPSGRQQRFSPAVKKPPEPLRRVVADCLSPSAPNLLHGTPSAVAYEAARTLRDYIASPSTIDMAYSVLVEHALAERDRSPAVVPRCVALLKRYLLRCVPKVQTLQQIDLFCANLIAECKSVTNRRVSLWSKSLSQHSGTSAVASNAIVPSLPASNFASASLVKSLNYVRSLVARHSPKLSFQPVARSGSSTSAKQSLPTLSSLLSRSFASQLSPEVISNRDSLGSGEDSGLFASGLSSLEKVDGEENNKYIFLDLLKWRWPWDREHQVSSFTRESDCLMSPHNVHIHGFLEVGAAALLVGDMEMKRKEKPWIYSVMQDLPDFDLLQPSKVAAATNFASAYSHLKAITASKRMKPGPHQVWIKVPASTFHPRAHPLFQYRHYSEQLPLRLNPAEICEVIAEVCSESSSPQVTQLNASLQLTKHGGQPGKDVAINVLIKLVVDMYVMDAGIAAPFTLYMLEGMLSSKRVASRIRAFDLILNLAVHAQLLEPMLPEDSPAIEEVEPSQEPSLTNEEPLGTLGKMNAESNLQQRMTSSVFNFESWLLVILFEILRLLVQTEEREEIVWASALSCLFCFVCDRGKILRSRLEGLDIRVVKALLEISGEHSWAEVVHYKLICMLTNMFYQTSNGALQAASDAPTFLAEQVDLLGGIDFICLEYSRANSREEKRDLFLVLFDHAVYQINEACLASGNSAYAYDEIKPVASVLTLADAPEAFYIAVKHGVEGIGEVLKRSVSAALSRSTNYERQILLLDKITRKLDATISTFTRLDNEFSYMIRITKSYKSLKSIENGLGETGIGTKARLCWATVHSLLHSEISAFRHQGYIWLAELLLSEISEDSDRGIWSSVKKLQQQISIAGNQDSTSPEVPLSISIMCGLLKSKHNFIRWGFLYVLEKLLMQCKFLLDESEMQHVNHEGVNENCLDKANAVIDIMTTALSLVVQINETDYINILKMCDMLFSQLCLRLQSANEMPFRDVKSLRHLFGCTTEIHKGDLEAHVSQETLWKNNSREELPQNVSSSQDTGQDTPICKTASAAVLLLRGQAIAPMQLVAHVPTSLFYWPLIQLAGAATDDIALGIAVGSQGRGNLPGATSDIRAALLLLLIGKCTAEQEAFQEVEGKEFFRGLLDDTDSRVAYYSAAFLLKRMMTEEPQNYQRMLQSLIIKAQQCNNEKLLENPYLQMRGIIQLSNYLGTKL
uniref:Uncharacterized protein LOC105056966 n=1 Tax=Elaeis guineensis var. tenera TaxID=51953 RepID=A0A6J0PRG7_ELAGV|nr:uncharacterized protein LOC105056966 [Elaeis guineensis]XP_019710453.1 uncharacterized protein LOC105056966 [Elaeis guineensis]XP_019710454.1 uncharacterized protein LOC105056966 [Elaeis guineensis]XP_019710456.1 uncharacterized protein LOC105056966 [Elaeis guineensis]XP_019710457.1 uncharacterized protein LOC105056966 [Elaeis guineensis]